MTDIPGNNVIPFNRPDTACALEPWELAALDDGNDTLDRHLEAVSAGRVQDLDGRDGVFRLAWRSRNVHLIRRWQATAGPTGALFDDA